MKSHRCDWLAVSRILQSHTVAKTENPADSASARSTVMTQEDISFYKQVDCTEKRKIQEEEEEFVQHCNREKRTGRRTGRRELFTFKNILCLDFQVCAGNQGQSAPISISDCCHQQPEPVRTSKN